MDAAVGATGEGFGAVLGMTSEAFVAAFAGRVIVEDPNSPTQRMGGTKGAMEAYRRLWRDGRVEMGLVGGGVGIVPRPVVKRVLREESSEGEVVKFLVGVGAGVAVEGGKVLASGGAAGEGEAVELNVESVLIPMIGKGGHASYTLCVSSQVGCAMGCVFCETAQMGLIRNLGAHEIAAQLFAATHCVALSNGERARVENIVFMGMGEPMDNFDAVLGAIAVMKDHNGPHIAVSQITVSTVGRVDGIRKMAEAIKQPGWHRLGLALSLNAPNDAVRSEIMPINRKYDMAALQSALMEWPRFAGNKICVEYVLIPGVNDGEQHLDEVAAFVEPLKNGDGTKARAMVNLIPYNPRRNSPWPAPDEARVEWFLAGLIARGVFAKRRRTKGRRMMGACGQLGTEEIRGRKLVGLGVSAPKREG